MHMKYLKDAVHSWAACLSDLDTESQIAPDGYSISVWVCEWVSDEQVGREAAKH